VSIVKIKNDIAAHTPFFLCFALLAYFIHSFVRSLSRSFGSGFALTLALTLTLANEGLTVSIFTK